MLTAKQFDEGSDHECLLLRGQLLFADHLWYVSAWLYKRPNGTWKIGPYDAPRWDSLRRAFTMARVYGLPYQPSERDRLALYKAIDAFVSHSDINSLLTHGLKDLSRPLPNPLQEITNMPKKKIESRTIKEQLEDEQVKQAITPEPSHDFVDGKLPAPAPAPVTPAPEPAMIARSIPAVVETPTEPAVRVVSLEESKNWKRLDMNKPHPHALKFGWVKDTNGVWVKPPKTN